MPVLVQIQFSEDLFDPIEFVSAESAVVITVKQLKEARHRAASTFPFGRTIAIAWRLTLRATPFGSTVAIGTTIAIAARLCRSAGVTAACGLRTAITFGLAFRIWTAIAISTWLIGLASISASRFRTPFPFGFAVSLGFAIPFRAAFPLASLSHRYHIIERQDFLLRSFKQGTHAITELLGNFVERDFAVAVRVHSLETLFRGLIWPSTTISRSSKRTWRRTQLGHCATEFFLRQFILAELLEHLAKSLTHSLGQFIFLELAVVVLVEPLQEFTRRE